jgi:hypothetical protein
VFFSSAARTIKPLDRMRNFRGHKRKIAARSLQAVIVALARTLRAASTARKGRLHGHLRRVNRAASGALPASTRHRKSAVPREKT